MLAITSIILYSRFLIATCTLCMKNYTVVRHKHKLVDSPGLLSCPWILVYLRSQSCCLYVIDCLFVLLLYRDSKSLPDKQSDLRVSATTLIAWKRPQIDAVCNTFFMVVGTVSNNLSV
jgi:hypothetical protein